ncbi:ATP-dependent DNA helicase RecG [Methylotuvimicrobium sp. KM1]|uniref:ATP-dependent DNA helicase RecG n=1 Tax=Methylotuvimicrobium sp. KM1 TaxID=3377707 RepID=UPI00384D1AE5
MDRNDPLDQSVASLGGIGKQTASKLEKLGIRSCQDLIFHLPHRYEDRTRIQAIGTLKPGMTALIKGKVELTDTLLRGRKSLICRIGDGTGFISLRFFHFSAAQLTQLSPGTYLSCFAEVRHGYAGLEMIHPDYKILNNPEQTVTEDTLRPVYPLTEGLSQSLLRKAIKQTLNLHLKHLIDWLPKSLLQRFNYPTLIEAINFLHAPNERITAETLLQNDNPARKRLAFEELLSHHLSLRVVREQAREQPASPFTIDETTRRHFLKSLPFQLTGAQQRVITEIEADCSQQQPMLRLVQGDVGSGKTVVSAYAALLALATGYQVAVMAPTELLAEQHFRNFNAWFDSFQTQIIFLTGQIKGNTRKAALETLEDGSAGIVIGTHALFQESVTFKKLGLIVIDEQHRFGVHQRMALRDKGRNAGIRPHQLVMTATPIPRTLAMLQYSDLDISVIDELPPGRKPIVTSVIPSERREEVIARIGNWIAQKRQAYWVCTLIEESEALQCEAAEKTAELLTQVLPDIRIGLVHGRMKAADKDAVMQDFKNQRIDLLVATTVIEVGVDVPNAGLMIIENPERLGLSQLHQLRGRVGRGKDDSYCLLLYQSPLSDTAKHRLGILRDTNDGFVIAEKDLELRGPGEVMGTRQTGQMQFKIADLDRDTDLLDNIPTIAESLLHHSPDAVQPLIKRWLGETVNYAEV